MSTRPSTTKPSQQPSNLLRSENSHRRSRRATTENHDSLKEKTKFDSQNGRSEARAKKGRKKEVFCSCRGKDDGTPMICCALCTEWYHFNCIGLSEQDAEDIDVFVCSSCQVNTALRTVREWEGLEALEEVDEPAHTEDATRRKASTALTEESHAEEVPARSEESESSGDSSSDEYIAEGASTTRQSNKRRIRRISTSSNGSEMSSGDERHTSTKRTKLSRTSRRIRTSSSPAPITLKRKQSNASEQQPSKKQKSGTYDDPTRKYCLGKLQEIFCQIFLKYPYFRDESEGRQELDLQAHFTKNSEDLTDEEKSQLEEKAKEYAAQVEQSVFEVYSEPDKHGQPAAASKYKERFRMLDFNLKKQDRIVVHKRIVSSVIAPGALSLMSSTDLASEEEKQSIKLAEQESLAHSILHKPTAPRAKITHKGLQDIEDVNGELASQRDVELDREQEEDERRDRERMARLRAAAASGSAAPESPVVPESPTWGAPPPIPLHALQQDHSPTSLPHPERPSLNPLFVHSAPNPATQHQIESELNLADLINIDEDTPQEEVVAAESMSTPVPENTPVTAIEEKQDTVAAPTSPTSPPTSSPTGISPFAVNVSKPDTTTRPSFDLSSVWSAPKAEDNKPPPEPPTLPTPEEPKDPMVDVTFFGEEADDKDFDMFLEKDYQENEAGSSSEGLQKQPVFNDFPQVWKGSLHMPLDSTIPQDVPVVARQMGGRTLESDSPLWKVLFPSDNLRIDGRVPVNNSSQYLLQMRMNSIKELVAVAFSPPNESESLAFKFLMDHLLGKNRHGLIFPWGSRPKDHHPGRELYVIPLLSSDPLPDYMELLDSLRLPTIRTENLLVGIWILNKGKLVLPPVASQSPIPGHPQFAPPNPQMSILHATPPPVLQPPSIPAIPLGPPPPQPPPPSVPVNSAALAAEVASLTPDQIQRMLQSLSAAGTSVPAILQQQIQQQQQQQHQPPLLTPPQPWSNGAPPFPTFPPLPHSAASQSPPRPPYPRASHPQYDQYDHYERDGGPDRGRRGGRGGRNERGAGGRGRGGRGGSWDRGDRGDRTRDSGWPKRGGRGSSNSGWGGERQWT